MLQRLHHILSVEVQGFQEEKIELLMLLLLVLGLCTLLIYPRVVIAAPAF